MNEKKLVDIIEIRTEIRLRVQDIDDIMCTALEGGINYWCNSAKVVGEYLGEYASEQIARGGELILHDVEGEELYSLTLPKLTKGIKRWLEEVGIQSEAIDRYSVYLDCGMIDAEDADCIIQYALFDEIIYG